MASAAKKSKLEEIEEKRKTRYSKEYDKEYDFVRECSSGIYESDYKFHCMVCNIDLSCAGGGRNDICTESHKNNYEVMRSEHCEIFFVTCSSAFFYITENYRTIHLISTFYITENYQTIHLISTYMILAR